MLWLCVHLGRLPLEVFTRGGAMTAPLVVTEGRGTRRRVFEANAAAEKIGIRRGASLGAAYALCAELQVRGRDLAAEAHALGNLAGWAGRFSSWVSLAPAAVLVEVQGSLELFGGLERLVSCIERGVRSLGYEASTAIAPTPLAAEFLARAVPGTRLTSSERLVETLSPLPLRGLGLPGEKAKDLERMGLRTLGDCLGQPREGILRRCGPECLDSLDRALGKRPDPRPSFVPPPSFECRLELPADVESAESLLFAANRVLLELEGFLRARGAGVRRIGLALVHREKDPTQVNIGLSSPTRDPRRLVALLRERLATTILSAPVSSLLLSTTELLPLVPATEEFFAEEGGDDQDFLAVLDRLRARLGAETVSGLRLLSGHRPEKASVSAWVDRERKALTTTKEKRHWTGESRAKGALPLIRPFWLLEEPAPVSADALTLICGPERVESGWWDGEDVARDYFVAEDQDGCRLWVYRDRSCGRGWFVHGLFG